MGYNSVADIRDLSSFV